MFVFSENVSNVLMWLVWLLVLLTLFAFNEITRRYKSMAMIGFIILPIVLTILWLTLLKESTYMDWFHVAKVYSATIGCIGFFCIRHIKGASKNKWILAFPAVILAVNILEAVCRDFEVGLQYGIPTVEYLHNQVQYYLGGPWNFMNGIAGILNILTITGWFGICISKEKSKDMLWPDMLWFWIIAYDLWNFAYTYNCLPTHSWYCGLALLLAPSICAFTIGKGAWLQHRAHTLALWCMFAQTFPKFQDASIFMVHSSSSASIAKAAIAEQILASDGYTMLVGDGIYTISSANPNTMYLWIASSLALFVNIAVFVYMLYKVQQKKKNPYANDLYTDLSAYKKIKALAR